MHSILQLPTVSAAFQAHIRHHELRKNEWVPCPRCGASSVQAATGVAVGALVGVSMMGCLSILMFGFIVILMLIFPPLGILLLIGTIALFFIVPAFTALFGGVYQCKACNFAWTFKDIETYKRALVSAVGLPLNG
jgi:hypothetical protein